MAWLWARCDRAPTIASARRGAVRPWRPAARDRPPDHLRRRRHLDVAHAELGQRVDDRIRHCRHRADAAGFAGALDAERIALGRYRMAVGVDGADVLGTRHGGVHERAGDELAVAVE